MRPFFTALFCAMLMISQVFAQTKNTKKPIPNANKYATLLVAYVQRYIPADTARPPVDKHKFIITWSNPTATPESMFWRGVDDWKMCKISRVLPKARKSDTDDNWYTLAAINPDDIKPGDILEIAPLENSNYRLPEEIEKNIHYTLYMRSVTSPWMPMPIPTKIIRRLPDVFENGKPIEKPAP